MLPTGADSAGHTTSDSVWAGLGIQRLLTITPVSHSGSTAGLQVSEPWIQVDG